MAGKFGPKLGSGGTVTDTSAGLIDANRMRQERKAKAQAALKKNGVAAALLFRNDNIRYVTAVGYSGGSFVERLNNALLFAEHEPILHSGMPIRVAPPWLKQENVKMGYHWAAESAGRDATRDAARKFAALVKSELAEKGLGNEKLGLDGGLDEAGRQALVEAGIALVNAQPAMLEARAIKTQDEINCFHMASILVDTAHYAMYQAIKPGTRHRDIEAVGVSALIKGGAEHVWQVMVSSGGGGGGDRIIQVGDVVTIDIVRANYLGYMTCCYRNYVVGRKPTDKEKDLHKKSYERMYKVIDTIKPGVSTADCAKYWTPAKEKGWPDERYMWCDDLAHGMGLSLYEYPIIDRLWSLDYPQTLEKGMTMAIECMEFDPIIGRTKLEEMIAVTDTGVQIFTRMPVKEMMIASPIYVGEGDIASD